MKLLASLALALVLLAGVGACSKEPAAEAGKPAAAAPAKGAKAETWICPMDKEIVSDKPADCPKCGMKLELKK
jgi:uncharacterized paraquat-inducible protein A